MPKIPIRKPGYSIEHDSWFIPLTQGVIALIDADMVPVLAQRNWSAAKRGGGGGRWCATASAAVACGKRARHIMSRVVMDAPPDLLVDHRLHLPLGMKVIDNRRANLRICDKLSNNQNKRPNARQGSSRFKGVSWVKREGKWHVEIYANGVCHSLGNFRDEVAAARVYDAAAIRLHGEFACTNASMGLFEQSNGCPTPASSRSQMSREVNNVSGVFHGG